MIIEKLEKMFRGWFIGDFEPSVFRTREFEAGVLKHSKGEIWPEHYHKVATEVNVLLEGSMSVNNIEIKVGDIFVISPGEVAAPVFFEDCKILCVKVPSIIGDKYETICK